MINRSDTCRGFRLWRAGFLSLVISLGAGSGELHAQEALASNLIISHEAGGPPACIQIAEPGRFHLPDGSGHAQDIMKVCDAAHAKIRHLTEELTAQRSENTRLNVELAETKAEAAEIQDVSRQQEALLAALTAVVATRHDQYTAVRSENTDLRQRLDAAQSELQRKKAENDRLAAEVAAAQHAAAAATVMAQENLAVIDVQLEILHAALGNATLARAEQLLRSVAWDDAP